MSTSSTPTPPHSHEPYHHGNLRQALVEAGLALLARDGQPDFSLREAARMAGVTVNATYRHFANKDALVTAISAAGFRQLGARMRDNAAPGGSTEARLLAAAHGYVDFARDHPALFRLMFGRFGVSGHGAELDAATTDANTVLREGVADLLGPGADPATLQIAVLRAWALAHGVAHLVIDGQIDAQAAHYRNLVDALLRSYRPA